MSLVSDSVDGGSVVADIYAIDLLSSHTQLTQPRLRLQGGLRQ